MITEKESYSKMMDYVESRLITEHNAKKERGEVFTPLTLINSMLDHLPKEVWTNPNLTWLDPANGIGNFPICVYYRLMEGLKRVNGLQLPLTRSRHIIEKMLYMVELDPTNVAISKSIFCERDDGEIIEGTVGNPIEGNISKQDFLDEDLPKNFPKSFDIIIGNPPYNQGGTGRSSKKGLDNLFIIKSIKLLTNKGLLLFITKTGWRSLKTDVRKHLLNVTILYSEVFDFNKNPFAENVLTNFFVIKKTRNISNYPTTFKFKNTINEGVVNLNMNIYFLQRDYFLFLYELKIKYGNLNNITRHKPNNKNVLLISHSTQNVLTSIPDNIKKDEYYIIENPNKIMTYFFNSNLYKDLRKIGRFTGFATSKALFMDIPNFNEIPSEEEDYIIKKLELLFEKSMTKKNSEYNKEYYIKNKQMLKKKATNYYRKNKTIITIKKHFKEKPVLLGLNDLNKYINNLHTELETSNNISLERKSIILNLC